MTISISSFGKVYDTSVNVPTADGVEERKISSNCILNNLMIFCKEKGRIPICSRQGG